MAARPLTRSQLLGLAALLEDEAMLTQALADYLIDHGHEYAAAVAEKAATAELERIAERLYSESAHEMSKGDANEYTAAVLSGIAIDLMSGVPTAAPKSGAD